MTPFHLKPQNGAVEYQHAKKEVHKIIRDKSIVGHSLKGDFKVLDLDWGDNEKWSVAYCSEQQTQRKSTDDLNIKVLDLAKYPRYKNEQNQTMSLKKLSEKHLNKKI